jgi:branched-chain amino acid transport system substrate-binding protein
MKPASKFVTSLLVVAALLAVAAATTPNTVRSAAPQQSTPAATQAGTQTAATGEPIYIGVSGPITGPNAQYGAQWKKGFDLALEEINGSGGINNRPLAYDFEDSQSDPKQSVIIAQKFVADPRIVVELGDFSSTASMAASQIYQRGGLVQFGFTNSHPDFTKAGGDYTWSNSVTQAQESPALADFAITTLGFKKLAVFQLNNDWGVSTNDLFAKRVTELGGTITRLHQTWRQGRRRYIYPGRVHALRPAS